MASVTRRTLLALCASPLAAQHGGSNDDTFSLIPFDRWLAHPEDSHIRWHSRISEPALSTHQRFIVSLAAEVDGAELAKRRGKGRFVLLAQVTDSQGVSWRSHVELGLEKMEESMKSNNVDFTLLLFALPGDYEVVLAIYDDATSEHSVRRHHLHINPLRNDPLPAAWEGLPPIEFIPVLEAPEKWFLPSIEGILNLAASPREPLHIDLIVNLTPSEHLAGSTQAQNKNFEVLIPAAKVFSQIDWGTASFGITLLDLSRNRLVYQQEDKRPVNWTRAISALKEVNSGIIDAKALQQRPYSANFFVSEVRRRITSGSSGRTHRQSVIIVLTSAVRFNEPQTLQPIAPDEANPAKVFYLRYQTLPRLVLSPPDQRGRSLVRSTYALADQLEPILKPLDPRLFDIETGEQFRKALASILAEISHL